VFFVDKCNLELYSLLHKALRGFATPRGGRTRQDKGLSHFSQILGEDWNGKIIGSRKQPLDIRLGKGFK
jgi:hypothetical protein